MATPASYDATAEQGDHWKHVASLSPAELHGRLRLVESIVAQRMTSNDPTALAITRAVQGWTEAELAAGERRH